MFARRALEATRSLLYPARCSACDASCPEEAAFCTVCEISLEPITDACARCGVPLAGTDRGVCIGCQVRPPPDLTARSRYLYGGSLAIAIRRCKYGDRPDIARSLGQFWREVPPTAATVVTPVPLHVRKLRRRGFNQSALLAMAAGLRIDVRALERVRDTPPQSGLKPEERRRNMAGAFVARPDRVAGRNVLIVDDVLTTGATVEAAVHALLLAHAAEVHVLTLARAVP
jgi:ComF family protein